jgi:hypothetical protein
MLVLCSSSYAFWDKRTSACSCASRSMRLYEGRTRRAKVLAWSAVYGAPMHHPHGHICAWVGKKGKKKEKKGSRLLKTRFVSVPTVYCIA